MTTEISPEAWLSVSKAARAALARARQLVSLKVNEVSVVDRPAILREFLAIKRLEEVDMPKELKKEAIEASFARVRKSYEGSGFKVAKRAPLSEEEAKKRGEVVEWMRKSAAQAEGAVQEAILDQAALLEMEAKGEVFVDANGNQAPTNKNEPEDDKPADAAANKAEDGKLPPFMQGKGKKKQKATSLDGDGGEFSGTSIHIGEDGGIHITQKGVSAEAKEIATVKTAFFAVAEQLAALAGDTGFDAAMAEFVRKADLPDMRVMTWTRGVNPQGTGAAPTRGKTGVDTTKRDDGNDDDGDTPPQWAVDLQKRLDKIEKSRTPATSVTEDGGTEGGGEAAQTKVEKAAKFWSNVL